MAFTWLLKFPLPAVEQNANQLTKQLFVLLKDYSKAGAARGENYLLVQNCFKVLRVVRACTGVAQVLSSHHRPPAPCCASSTLSHPDLHRDFCCSLSGHHHTCQECQEQQDFRDTAAGAAGIRRGGHLRPVPPGHGLRTTEGNVLAAYVSPFGSGHLSVHVCLLPPGNPVQEAYCS